MNVHKAILLINIGSPDTYRVKDVRTYLKQFLLDKRVINMPLIPRFLLVSGIIVPFRAPKSAAKYKEIWTENGSPLIVHSENLKHKLQNQFGETADVYMAMRYGNPSLEHVLAEIHAKNYTELVIVPMYPHNAASTTSSSVAEVNRIMAKWENYPNIKYINEFWNHPLYLEAMDIKVRKYNYTTYDHVVFSFHGLPLSQVHASHKCHVCDLKSCLAKPENENRFCYQAQCYKTVDLLVNKLGFSEDQYSVGFQSRLSKNWLEPFTDELLKTLSAQGKKRILVICPSFVADCLETIHEIEIEYAEEFIENGGEELVMVPALNDDIHWVENLKQIISSYSFY